MNKYDRVDQGEERHRGINDGKTYNMKYYNLDMIVAIGFKVKSNIDTKDKKIIYYTDLINWEKLY